MGRDVEPAVGWPASEDAVPHPALVIVIASGNRERVAQVGLDNPDPQLECRQMATKVN